MGRVRNGDSLFRFYVFVSGADFVSFRGGRKTFALLPRLYVCLFIFYSACFVSLRFFDVLHHLRESRSRYAYFYFGRTDSYRSGLRFYRYVRHGIARSRNGHGNRLFSDWRVWICLFLPEPKECSLFRPSEIQTVCDYESLHKRAVGNGDKPVRLRCNDFNEQHRNASDRLRRRGGDYHYFVYANIADIGLFRLFDRRFSADQL